MYVKLAELQMITKIFKNNQIYQITLFTQNLVMLMIFKGENRKIFF